MFTGNGSNTLALVVFYAKGVSAIFLSLDNIQFLDFPVSILDVFVSIMLFYLLMWYITRIITGREDQARIEAYGTAESRDEQRRSMMDVESDYGSEGDD